MVIDFREFSMPPTQKYWYPSIRDRRQCAKTHMHKQIPWKWNEVQSISFTFVIVNRGKWQIYIYVWYNYKNLAIIIIIVMMISFVYRFVEKIFVHHFFFNDCANTILYYTCIHGKLWNSICMTSINKILVILSIRFHLFLLCET